MIWRYEAYWVMLWALGYVNVLSPPRTICDVKKASAILYKLRKEDAFYKQAKLRSQTEILNAADLIYRYHWAVRQARLDGKKAPAKLMPDVVMERHKALNWLIGYSNQSWDEVTTDT